MGKFGCCIGQNTFIGGSNKGNTSFGGGPQGKGTQGKGTQGKGFGIPWKKALPPKKKYCMKDILDAMKEVESGGEKNPCAAVAYEKGKPFSFGAFQISEDYFKAAMKTFTEKCGVECTQYPWLHNGKPSVMCKNDGDAKRADEWSRCIVISYMWRYANQAGRGVHLGSYVGPGALDTPHNDSPWMDARVLRGDGKTNVGATAKKRRKMTDRKGNPKPGFTKKNGKQHGDWPPGGSKFGAKSKKGKRGAIDRLCDCEGTEEDCELVARIHNGGAAGGNYHDNRSPSKEEASRQRWDNTTNYWDKVQKELRPTGKKG